MDFSNFWWQSQEEEVDIPRYALRFRGASGITRNFGTPTDVDHWTYSAWVKRSTLGQRADLFGTANVSPYTNDNVLQLFYSGSDVLMQAKNNPSSLTEGVYRDTSAWYHIVWQNDGGNNLTIFVNNEAVDVWDISAQASFTAVNGPYQHSIGFANYPTGGASYFDGYMADIHFVDGLTLPPTEFGQYDEDNNWTPKDFKGEFGNNGFALYFNGDTIGPTYIIDSSKNNNTCQTFGFNFVGTTVYSSYLFTSSSAGTPDLNSTTRGFEAPGGYANNAFDGRDGWTAATINNEEWIIWRPAIPIIATSKLQLQLMNPTSNVIVNGVDTGISTTAGGSMVYTDISPALTFPVTIETIAMRGAPGYQGTLARVEVDGVTLVDVVGTDYDLLSDYPSQNKGVFNPRYANSLQTTKANLAKDVSGVGNVVSSFEILPNTGKYYFEIIPDAAGDVIVGIGARGKFLQSGGIGSDQYGWSYWNGGLYFNQNTMAQSPETFSINDVIGILYDSDAHTLKFSKNGLMQPDPVWQEQIEGPLVAAVGALGDGSPICNANFGQLPFLYKPDDYRGWSEQPDRVVTKPSDHFQVILDDGANILSSAQAAVPDGIWWIKDRFGGGDHNIVSSVQPGNNVVLSPTQTPAPYTTPTGASIAWCWASPATGVANNDGSIPTTVYANQAAGFSQIRFTGSSGPGTIGHGLGKAPAFIIANKTETSDSRMAIYHKDILDEGEKYYMFYTTSAKAWNYSDTNFWANTKPTDTIISVGGGTTGSHTNDSGQEMMLWAWAEVPGYSSFGTYTGLGQDDGPFVFTGFRPALVIIRNTDQDGGSWLMYTAETSDNPINDYLTGNASAPNNTPGNAYNNIEIYADGFKITDTLSLLLTNQSGANYVYMAWAEHPYLGANVSSALAR